VSSFQEVLVELVSQSAEVTAAGDVSQQQRVDFQRDRVVDAPFHVPNTMQCSAEETDQLGVFSTDMEVCAWHIS